MQRRIYGVETEFGVTCTFHGQRRLSPDEVARYLSVGSSPGAARRTCSCATAPGSTSTSAATRSTRRPSATRSSSSSRTTRRGADPRGPARRRRAQARRRGHRRRHLPVQEQHRLGGQLLRLPRELPRRAGGRVFPDRRRAASVPGHAPADLRGGQGPADPARRRLLPLAACRAHLGGRLERHHALAPDHQHARRAARRRRALPPSARHRGRLEHVRGHDAAEGRHHAPRAGDDRGGRPVPGLHARQPDPRHPRDQPRPHRAAHGPPGGRARGQCARHPARVPRPRRRARRHARQRGPDDRARAGAVGPHLDAVESQNSR